ncbi:hypothetical protein GCM10023144_30590 [Pigmentiphaga soli]|uniref:DUF1488 domain-containing protein n=1 Tax=Pigmentiphaga soli TaxID=1007095 RepID=A0ABP8HAQ8_9BURK
MSFDPEAKAEPTCVRFRIRLPDGGMNTAAVSARALVECFGAEMNADSLLDCYRKHFRAIHATACERGEPASDGGVLVTASSLRGRTADCPL